MRRLNVHRSIVSCCVSLTAFIISSPIVPGNVFQMPSGQTSLQFVSVGSPGNAPDPNAPPWIESSIGYDYSIGEFDVTNAQYVQFLNAVATTSDSYGVYSGGAIVQSGSPGAYSYSVASVNQNLPVSSVSWGDAARFVNWLNNGQPSGPEGPTTTETGSYMLNGATTTVELITVSRDPNAKFVLPTIGEWYKAAYYDPTSDSYFIYPAGTNSSPIAEAPPGGSNSANFDNIVGGLTDVGAYTGTTSPSGAYDMMGDVLQWTDTLTYESYREVGSSYDYSNVLLSGSLGDADYPTTEFYKLGFRVAEVPEPSAGFIMVVLVCRTFLARRRRSSRIGDEVG